jgi:hypothetical protein
MAAASRSLATALWKARVASGSLPQSYTTGRDTTAAAFLAKLTAELRRSSASSKANERSPKAKALA